MSSTPNTGESAQIDVELARPEEILPLRELYRGEMRCQIIRDSWFGRGWTAPYRLRVDDRVVGYGLVGGVPPDPKDTVIEFYVSPPQRGLALPLFRRLAATSGAKTVASQTNDILLTLMLYDCAAGIESDAILFADARTTHLSARGAVFRRATDAEKERIFPHTVEPVGDYVIEADREVVATGGILLHYNLPYSDIFMEVAAHAQRRGYGAYLVQELKRTAYELGRVPAARCGVSNAASRATLQKAGFLPCARMLRGAIATELRA